jgi:hypothetical protein
MSKKSMSVILAFDYEIRPDSCLEKTLDFYICGFGVSLLGRIGRVRFVIGYKSFINS